MCKKKCCESCGYVERDAVKGHKPRLFCSNRKSDRCFGWVEEDDLCDKWVQYSQQTRFYND